MLLLPKLFSPFSATAERLKGVFGDDFIAADFTSDAKHEMVVFFKQISS